jgi:hypothetical protein
MLSYPTCPGNPSSKSEARNPKQIQNSNRQIQNNSSRLAPARELLNPYDSGSAFIVLSV